MAIVFSIGMLHAIVTNGQEQVDFQDMDGFSGQVSVTVKKGYYFEPYFTVTQQRLVISSYENGEYDEALKAGGITFPYTVEESSRIDYNADARISEGNVINGGNGFFESVSVAFNTTRNLGSGQEFPAFSEKAKEWLKNKGTDQSIVGKGLSGGEPAWNQYGAIENIEVTRVYLTDLKNEMQRLIQAHKSEESDRKRTFEALISKAKTLAEGGQFEEAESSVEEARGMAKDSQEQQVIRDTEMFIFNKKIEKRDRDEMEPEDTEEEETDATGEAEREEEPDFWSSAGAGHADPSGIATDDTQEIDGFWLGQGTRDEEMQLEKKIANETDNEYLGEKEVNTREIEIAYYDHGSIDGDRVSVLLNGQIVASNVTLTASPQSVVVQLREGTNRVSFQALNEGTASPNTATFYIYDGEGKEIYQNAWNITEGYRSTLLVIKN